MGHYQQESLDYPCQSTSANPLPMLTDTPYNVNTFKALITTEKNLVCWFSLSYLIRGRGKPSTTCSMHVLDRLLKGARNHKNSQAVHRDTTIITEFMSDTMVHLWNNDKWRLNRRVLSYLTKLQLAQNSAYSALKTMASPSDALTTYCMARLTRTRQGTGSLQNTSVHCDHTTLFLPDRQTCHTEDFVPLGGMKVPWTSRNTHCPRACRK